MISLSRFKERKIVQWALAYVAGAWLVLQVVDLLVDNFGWQSATFRVVAALLAVGFLAALVIAWYHGEGGTQRVSGIEIGLLTGILVIAAAGVTLVGRGVGTGPAAGDVPLDDAGVVQVAEQGSIAVLPFLDMSAGKDQAYFSDGLTEELLNVLAKLPELRVAARTSSFAFRNKDVGVDSIGRALHVAHVLEGSVRTAGSMVRITAQLVNAETGYHLWSETYDRELKDVFAVQDEISRAIVDQLQLELAGAAAGGALASTETDDAEAHRLVLRASYSLTTQRTRDAVAEAVALTRQAIDKDPAYANAWAVLASARHYQAYRRWAPSEESYADAKQSAERALQLDPGNAEAHVVLGRIADTHEWRFETAEAHFRRAVELNPNHAAAHSTRAWLLMRLGRTDASIASARRAVELDRISGAARNGLASMYSYAGDMAAALDEYVAALELTEPSSGGIIYCNLALQYSEMGRHDDALRASRTAMTTLNDDPFAIGTAGIVAGRAGLRPEAEAALRTLESQGEGTHYLRAGIVLVLGDRARALALLEEAVEDHADYVVDLAVDPTFAPLHGDPKFTELVRRIGLPDA